MSNNKLIELREDIISDFNGTVIDIETIGEFNDNRLYKICNDSRQYESIQQVILGLINRHGLKIFCAEGNEAINDLAIRTKEIIEKLERPLYGFNVGCESSVWFHQLGITVIFDGELQKEKFESKASARRTLRIPNYDDPFDDRGYDCMKAWERGNFDQAIAHNRACLLKERDILLKRGFRTPEKIQFNKSTSNVQST
mgnify:CR=1 FL=1